ncbi:hypothetical protein MHU86_16125 [Fragilaria crotonensis]|nr:hypothetical protein MHU86_16125 [Fragilaria crotonensis]
MLLKKIQHPQLQNADSALRIRSQLDPVTFTECANHLSAIVSELPDHQLNRKISAADAKPKAKRISGGGTSNSLASKRKSIAALKLTKAKDDNTSATDDSSGPDNAGNAFGGRNSKKSRKE